MHSRIAFSPWHAKDLHALPSERGSACAGMRIRKRPGTVNFVNFDGESGKRMTPVNFVNFGRRFRAPMGTVNFVNFGHRPGVDGASAS